MFSVAPNKNVCQYGANGEPIATPSICVNIVDLKLNCTLVVAF